MNSLENRFLDDNTKNTFGSILKDIQPRILEKRSKLYDQLKVMIEREECKTSLHSEINKILKSVRKFLDDTQIKSFTVLTIAYSIVRNNSMKVGLSTINLNEVDLMICEVDDMIDRDLLIYRGCGKMPRTGHLQ